jgi:hypothetical protein
MNTPNQTSTPAPVDRADPDAAVGGVSIDEADLPESDLSTTYVPDDEQEPVDHGR